MYMITCCAVLIGTQGFLFEDMKDPNQQPASGGLIGQNKFWWNQGNNFGMTTWAYTNPTHAPTSKPAVFTDQGHYEGEHDQSSVSITAWYFSHLATILAFDLMSGTEVCEDLSGNKALCA